MPEIAEEQDQQQEQGPWQKFAEPAKEEAGPWTKFSETAAGPNQADIEHQQRTEKSRAGKAINYGDYGGEHRSLGDALSDVGESVLSTGEDLTKPFAVKPLQLKGQNIEHPLQDSMTEKYLTGPAKEQAGKAFADWQQPGIAPKISAAGHGLASAIPFVGPMAAQAGEDIGRGDIGAAAVDVPASILGAKGLGETIESARPALRSVTKPLAEALQRRSLAKATTEAKAATPPARSEINFNQQFERARPYLAKEQRTKPIKDVRQAYEASNSAVKGIEDKIGSYINDLPETDRVGGQEIMDRAIEKLNDPNSPRTPSERAAGIKSLEEFLTDELPSEEEGGQATREPKDLSVKEADRLRWRFNRDMESEMGMTEADRSDVRASNPKFAAKEAAAEALRDAIYDKLEDAGVPGVREIRGDEGAVMQMRDTFRKGINRAEKNNPPSAMRRLGVFGPVGLGFLGETIASHAGVPPGVSAAAGLGTAGLYEWMRSRMTPNALMERSMGRLGKSSLERHFPEMPIQGEAVQEPTAQGITRPAAAREVPPEYPALTEFAGREPSAPPPAHLTFETTGSVTDDTKLGLRGTKGTRQPVRGLLPAPLEEKATPTPPARGNGVNPQATQAGDIPLYVQSAAKEAGAHPAGYQPGDTPGTGWFQFHDPSIGGSFYLREGQVTAEAIKAKMQGRSGTMEPSALLDEKTQNVRNAMQEPKSITTEPEEESEPAEIKGITAPTETRAAAKQKAVPVEKRFSRDEIDAAEGFIKQHVDAMQSGDRPGVYYDENEMGEYNPHKMQSSERGITSGGRFRGVKSIRSNMPWMDQNPKFTPGNLEKALRNKDSALYQRAVESAIEFMRNEAHGAQREAYGLEEAPQGAEDFPFGANEQETKSITEEGTPEGVFPGMAGHVKAQEEGASRVKGEELSGEINRPRSITEAAGRMEMHSPLFRYTEANPQEDLFNSKKKKK